MSKATMPEPVAEICSGHTLHWAGSGPIAPLCGRTDAKVGSLLITTTQAEAYAAARAREALEEAAAICDEEAEAYQRHIETGKNKANALRCLCVAEGLADAIRAHSAKAEGKS